MLVPFADSASRTVSSTRTATNTIIANYISHHNTPFFLSHRTIYQNHAEKTSEKNTSFIPDDKELDKAAAYSVYNTAMFDYLRDYGEKLRPLNHHVHIHRTGTFPSYILPPYKCACEQAQSSLQSMPNKSKFILSPERYLDSCAPIIL